MILQFKFIFSYRVKNIFFTILPEKQQAQWEIIICASHPHNSDNTGAFKRRKGHNVPSSQKGTNNWHPWCCHRHTDWTQKCFKFQLPFFCFKSYKIQKKKKKKGRESVNILRGKWELNTVFDSHRRKEKKKVFYRVILINNIEKEVKKWRCRRWDFWLGLTRRSWILSIKSFAGSFSWI